MREHRYLAIEGVIGVGKTSLARLLAERLRAHLLLEEAEDNPFLSDFYRDRERYAFQTQIHFLFSRYRQQRDLRQTDLFRERTVSDYLFQKDRIFANLTLSDKELALYEKIVSGLEADVPRPDVVVYLQASPDVLVERVARRGRSFERDLDRAYLGALNEAYNYFFFHYREAPVLVVNTNDIDFVKNPADLEDLERRILEAGDGIAYYSPLPARERDRLTRSETSEPDRLARSETTEPDRPAHSETTEPMAPPAPVSEKA